MPPKGTVGLPTEPQFTPTTAPAETGFLRDADSEYKILEDLASKLSPDSQGTINLFTERPACLSCQGVIQQFEEAFPGVKVNLIEGVPQ